MWWDATKFAEAFDGYGSQVVKHNPTVSTVPPFAGNDCLKSDIFYSWVTMQKNGAFKKAYSDWEKDQSFSFGRLRARDTDFFHGTCKNARLRLDAEAPADSKVAELEANNFALEEKMAALEAKSGANMAALEAKFAALEAKLTAAQ